MKKESIFSKLESGNQNWLSFGVVIASFVVQIMSLSFGAELFWMTDWNTFLWGVILGSILLSVLLCISGYVGLKMRIPTAVQYGNIFGQVGARIMTLLLLPAGIIWVAWMSDIAATSVTDIFPELKEYENDVCVFDENGKINRFGVVLSKTAFGQRAGLSSLPEDTIICVRKSSPMTGWFGAKRAEEAHALAVDVFKNALALGKKQ